MAIDNKYKVTDVAKDFKIDKKEVIEILTKFGKAPKSPAQGLDEKSLNIIFDYLTINNQTEDLENMIKAKTEQPKKESTPVEQPKVEQPAKAEVQPKVQNTTVEQTEVEKPKMEQPKMEKPKAEKAVDIKADKANNRGEKDTKDMQKSHNAPKVQNNKQNASKAPVAKEVNTKPQTETNNTTEDNTITSKKQVHRIDTRGDGNVDLSKYDERIDALVPDKANKYSAGSSKQKITKKTDGKKQFSNKKRLEDQERMKRLQQQQQQAKKVQLKVMIPDEINVGELAMRLKRTASDVIKELMKLGVMASISQAIDFDTASLIAMEMGAKVEREVFVTIEERLFDEKEDLDEDLVERSPVVVVMGHVDHGKTSLLDTVRKANIASGEAGGITQHIGAYRVQINGKPITFLDTPGHAAFTSMRARGAQVTDVAILVVAADDGIMPQTIEAINHAKAANVPIIVAVNKMDKEGANPDRIMQQLTEHDVVPEEWGGDTIVCKISAKQNMGIEHLLEMILLTSEMGELRANPNRQAKGTVIEAKLDKGRGPVATLLVQNGTLNDGDIIIAGTAVGRIRAMTDDSGKQITSAGPSVPVEIIGLAEVPGAGDIFYAVEDERMARELAEERRQKEKDEKHNAFKKVTLENLFSHIEDGSIKDLNIIIKADVQGSAEALKASLEKIKNEEVRVRVIHSGVGAINESDVMLASASGAIIAGFNVRPERMAVESAIRQEVDIRTYRVIYDCIEEMEQAMRGMLAPKFKEVVLGHAEIRQTFKVSSVGTIGGAYVQDGKILRNASVRVVRDGIVIHDGILSSLKRFKEDAKEVAENYECGIGVEKYNDIKEGDIIEAYMMEEIKQ